MTDVDSLLSELIEKIKADEFSPISPSANHTAPPLSPPALKGQR